MKPVSTSILSSHYSFLSCRTAIGVTLLAFLLAVKAVSAQKLDVSAAWTETEDLCVTFVPHPPAHVSDGFSVSTPDGTELVALDKPAPDEDGEFPSYSTTFSVNYEVPSGFQRPDSILVTWQLCEGEICYLPETRSVRLDGGNEVLVPETDGSGTGQTPLAPAASGMYRIAASWDGHATPVEFLGFLSWDPRKEAAGGWSGFLADPEAFQRMHGWGLTVLLILAGGFLLNLTPCVLPMIPVNLAIIGAAASSGASRRVRFALGLAYGAGMAAVYGGLGVAVVRAGGVFGASLNASPLFAAAMAVLFAALGLAMFGAWNLDFSRWRRASRLAGHARFPAAFAAGGLSALLAGACVAPVLVAVLALAGNLHAAGYSRALFLPFLLGIGMALPWPLAAAGFAVLPKPGAWMEVVKKVFGVFILALAVWYAWSAATRFMAARNLTPIDSPAGEEQDHSAGYNGPPGFVQIDFGGQDAPERLEALMEEAAREKRPVLLDFGARWCKVCAMMDATTLRDASVVAALSDFQAIAIVADNPSAPEVAPLLERYGVRGYPAYRLLRGE